jgi:nitroimidazol reductase NimA-like FMN-containing flavoprotein (pyridoxamine 5'-phosphate oxidase superfamily)
MQPIGELDERFSDEGVSATDWTAVRHVIESAETFWVTTVRADGRPHVTPLVAVWLDDALAFCTGPDEQKAVNLRTNQHVILSTGCNDWDKGIDVIVEGTAQRVTDDAKLRRLAEAWTKKWDGRWQFEVSDGAFEHDGGEGQALVFEVRPTKILSFAKEKFAATRFRF